MITHELSAAELLSGLLSVLSGTNPSKMDPDRLVSLYERQKRKLDFAQALIPTFEQCGHEIGRFNSLRAICKWLDEHQVQPSPASDAPTKWHPQRLSDYLYMDGSEPCDEAINAPRSRKEGMRVAIRRLFEEARDVMESRPDLVQRWGTIAHWENRLLELDQRIVHTSHRLRRALGKT